MVRERDPQPISPPKQERLPLANISAKMQSPSQKQHTSKDEDEPSKERASLSSLDMDFGQTNPLRNPVRKPPTSVFIPKPKVKRPQLPLDRFASQASQPSSQSGFYRPGERRPNSQISSQPASQATANQSLRRLFDDEADYTQIYKPTNPVPRTILPPARPVFSSAKISAPSTLGQEPVRKPAVAQRNYKDGSATNEDNDNNDGDDDEFDVDAAVRDRSSQFGAVDPYMYMDSTQANESMRKLLEGAFDDGSEKSKTRLKKRIKQIEKSETEIKSLAGKLAALEVKSQVREKSQGDKEEDVEEEEEDGTVEGLAVKLLPHQVEGVSWMIDREIGKVKSKGKIPMGGMLADDMGLGKTVQSITLILTNPRPSLGAKPEYPKQKLPNKDVGQGTLVVAPLALIKQWESEIKSKVSPSHALKVLVHHGSNRTKSSVELKKYDVVITTYQCLTSEHASSNMSSDSGIKIGCMGVYWYRVILDEAHSIKNRSAKAHQACCALRSWYRWCLTGTPLQNNLDELQALIKFLRIRPYNVLSEWKDGILTPMKNGRGGLAMARLQSFLFTFMKRRTKDILKKEGALNFGGQTDKEGEPKKDGMRIVKREVEVVECDFDEIEQEFYSRLAERAESKLKSIMEGDKADYIGALVLLLRLRQACNHPHLITMAMNKDKDAMAIANFPAPSSKKFSTVDDELDDLTALMGGVSVQNTTCDVCQVRLSPGEAKDGAVRCQECEADLRAVKEAKAAKRSRKVQRAQESRTTQQKGTEPKSGVGSQAKGKTTPVKQELRRPRNRRVIDDSDDDEDDKGEWVGTGPERHIDLGVAGGTDDEDAEGGGETLGSIDTADSDEEGQDGESDDEADDMTDDDEESDSSSHSDELESEDSEDSRAEQDSSGDGSSMPIKVEKMPQGSEFNLLRGMATSERTEHEPSTKIRKLLRILHQESPKHKTIVFSQFTSMLDLIEPHLRNADLRYERYDGSMRPDERESALNSLRSNARTRVLLCSLKCGSLGLNLTAASRVVIVEPFWNPFVEEQAIDRVHRLNQTVDVKVFRLTIRHSVEERILELQEKKRELAKHAIEGGQGAGKLSMQDILGLFHHDAEHDSHHEKDRELWEKFGGDTRLLEGRSVGASSVDMIQDLRANHRLVTGKKPNKQGVHREHDVYGRRW